MSGTWFTPEQQPAVRDFLAVYDSHFDAIVAASWTALLSDPELGPALLAVQHDVVAGNTDRARAELRDVMAGDWAAYEDVVRARGAHYATLGVRFDSFRPARAAFTRRLVPFLVGAYGAQPERLSAAIIAMQEFLDRVNMTFAEGYAQAKDAALRALEERYRVLFVKNPAPMWMFDTGSLAFVMVNDAAVRQYGYSREEFARMTIADIRPPEDVATLREDVANRAAWSEGKTWRHRRKDGTLLHVEVRAHDFDVDGKELRLVLAFDVSERVRSQEALLKTEEQLRQSQKMEAIGRLAGGVAHDFNNLLSVIISYGELLISELGPGDAMREELVEMRDAGLRAADLTRQLLIFSRQQVVEPRILDLNHVLESMDKMLKRIVGEDIDLASLPGADLGKVLVDRGSIEQVIMNLVVNARDAMPKGGKLTLETANVTLDESYARAHVDVKPGPHVMLAVSDTGCGMTPATLARIFEPFFTTKEKGKGTGLGLSTVFGIVKQSGGSVWVYSEPDRGTTFKVYLPRTDAEAIASTRATASSTLTTMASSSTLEGTETILLVEDDDQVRAVARGILRRAGYVVLETRSAGEAILLCETHAGEIHLLLSDVVMPQMSGPELAKRLTRTRPGMKLLCMSGYTDDSIVRHGVLDGDVAFLEKPITPESLMRKVREVLNAGS